MPVALRPAGRDPGLAVVDVDGVPFWRPERAADPGGSGGSEAEA